MMTDPAPSSLYEERFVLRDNRDDVDVAQSALDAAIRERGYEKADCFAIRLALEEALVNAFKHGNKSDPAKSVTVECRARDDQIEIRVRDEGDGFDPTAVPDPTQLENIEIPAGRGIMLMRAYMSDVAFNDAGNEVTMVYTRRS